MRGAEFGLQHVRSTSRLILSLDDRDLPANGDYTVRVVDNAGAEVWHGVPERRGDWLQAQLSHALAHGNYWIRLSRGGEPVREYGIAVE